MSKWKVILFNQETYEIFDTEEEAQGYIDEIYENLPEGIEVLSQSGRHASGTEYGFGNDDLVLQVEEVD